MRHRIDSRLARHVTDRDGISRHAILSGLCIGLILAGCARDTHVSTATLPPPPGFGEPLSPGPWAFFPSHRQDWERLAIGIESFPRRLPNLSWSLCYVASSHSAVTAATIRANLSDLQAILQRHGFKKLTANFPTACGAEPREIDFMYLVPQVAIAPGEDR